jgi:predicted NUDIX family phosphoesterase/dephospho-CoA kinase
MVARSEFLAVADIILRREKRPMSARAIWSTGHENGDFSDKIAGETPWQTLKSKLSVHIRRYGERSYFVRTAAGRFYLRDLLDEPWTVYDAPPWVPPPSTERVVVFRSTALEALGRFQGIIDPRSSIEADLFSSKNLLVMDRRAAEMDDDHKQVLVYVMVRRRDQILAYRRGKYSLTDRMLVGSDCVGFGGHVNDADLDLFSDDSVGVKRAVARELLEELNMPLADRERLTVGQEISLVGYLNDDSSAVGRRHFAVIVEYWVANEDDWDQPMRGEESITKLRWLQVDANLSNAEQFEYWSQLVLRRFLPSMLRTEPSFRVARRSPLTPPHRLVVVGQVGSGKTEACNLLREEFGYYEIKTGRIMADLLGVPPIPDTPRAEFQEIAGRFVGRADGVERLARAIGRELELVNKERVLIDGIRHTATLDRVRVLSETGRLGVLYVETPPDVAFEFYQSREDQSVGLMGFLDVRDGPGEEEVRAFLGQADAVVYNWFGRTRYLSAVRRLMADLGIEPRAVPGAT